jgi:3-ketosteroid 9alpha-monooxygenase subunit A
VFTPHWSPVGWFQIGWSRDFPAQSVRPMRYFGRDLVAFRTQNGSVNVLDAYCRHLGGHLGYGGRVENDCVVCPFHGWQWDSSGNNVHIPYQPDRPNQSRRLGVWPTRERDGVVYLWHDPRGGEPAWEPADIFTDTSDHTADLDFHSADPEGLIRFEAVSVHPQFVLENSADAIHFRYVHGTRDHPVLLRMWEDDARWFSQIGFGTRWREMDPTSHDGDTLSILNAGVGLTYTSLSGTDNTLILLATTPIDAATSDMFQTVWLEKLASDDQPGVLQRRMTKATSQVPNDLVIWCHQRYEDPPALATSEGAAFSSLRRWSRRFYPHLPDALPLRSSSSAAGALI